MNTSEYELDYFKSKGFTRKKCSKCGRYYWTLGPWETCGEPPCEEYTFIGNSPMNKSLTLHEMREAYLKFFEKNGHTRVSRYPIVARWRDDVFFTQASIYDFQPWVIEGVVDPPANPLVISQTCVRFNDIDNVGKTGRHFTFFEMLAHHAFNKRNKEIYFKDRTVELCHEFFTNCLGVSPEKMRYIEEWWEGGGNSGPCLEVILDGVELATLVFMMYKDEPDGRKPLNMTVVDTGYGLERITWVSQGTSSAYEAVFGPVLQHLKEIAGISTDSRILDEYCKVAGMTNARTAADIKRIREMTAERIGISYGELIQGVKPLEDIYVICDHTRALAFMLNDGVVPSNVREGYFARLLVRRALRAMRDLGINIPLSEIVNRQIDFFSAIFTEMKENKEDILGLVDYEEEKYKETLARGRQLVSRITKNLGPEERISTEMLIELYDSHGLNPEIVQEFASLQVDIPDDFYIRVAARHEKPEMMKEESISSEVPENLPETKLLYYEDPELLEFEATVIAKIDRGVILDRTAFYPEGGGQEWDTGTLNGMKVTRVLRKGNSVVHFLEGDLFEVGTRVKGIVDKKRRIQLMRHHTAAHLINGIARKLLGNHVWQAGAHKSEDFGRLDITHHQNLTREQINALEKEVNHIVLENLPVRIKMMPRVEAEKSYGFRLYQGGVVPGAIIRVVEVEGVDAEACGGLHCKNTGQVGLVRISRTKRIQDGVVRIEYSVGMSAVENVIRDKEIVWLLSEKLKTTPEQLIPICDKILEELKQTKRAYEDLRTAYNNTILDRLLGNAAVIDNMKIIAYRVRGFEDPIEISRALATRENVLSVIVSSEKNPRILVSCGEDVEIDCRLVLKEITALAGGAGGGKREFAQAGGLREEMIDEVLRNVPEIVRKLMSGCA
jgi:alanyl-tRNA synthetase